jgi:pilus assembly protein CpaC
MVGLVFLFFGPFSVLAADTSRTKSDKTIEKVKIVMGKSQILPNIQKPKRVYVVEPNFVRVDEDVLEKTGTVLLTGLALGSTNIAVWVSDINKAPLLYDIEIVSDLALLKEQLHKMFPNEKNIKVNSYHDHLTLSGSVSNAAALSQVLELAKVFSPAAKEGEFKLINLLEVGGVQQVMLEVRVSEMSRSLGRRLGINFNVIGTPGRQGNISLLSRFPMIQDPSDLGVGTVIANYIRGDVTWNLLIDALKENGLLKVLAEPTLITLSGKEAKFLAGGEFPVPIPQDYGRVTIEYKPFGVGLAFTPIVLSNGKINMQVAPEVSELDFENSIALQGFIIPSITTRRVATTVELADGQSFAIAGLIKEEMRESIKKFPFLGDIPIIGPLFRSSSYQKRDSELIVIVTPHLVKPLDMAKQTVPTDQFVEPDDLEFYLLGASEGRGQPGQSTSSSPQTGQPGSGLEGKFGHITPK